MRQESLFPLIKPRISPLFIWFSFCVQRMYYFAIQYYGECWGAKTGTKYDKHGPANNCWSGVGGPFSNYVYKL